MAAQRSYDDRPTHAEFGVRVVTHLGEQLVSWFWVEAWARAYQQEAAAIHAEAHRINRNLREALASCEH